MGASRYYGQNAGCLRRQHGQCRDLRATGIQEMTQLAAQAAGTAGFNETALRSTLGAIAARAQATEDDISQAIAAGWTQSVQYAMHDGILTQEEETPLREFRDHVTTLDLPSGVNASADRITAKAGRSNGLVPDTTLRQAHISAPITFR